MGMPRFGAVNSTDCGNCDMRWKRTLQLLDVHAEGEIGRVATGGVPKIPGEKVAQQLAAARKALDKTFFTMVGCVIAQGDVPADDVADMLARFS